MSILYPGWEDVRRAREVLEATNGVLVAQTDECIILSQESSILGEEPVILMAEDIAPSETVQMDKTKLLSFVTRLGSANSHTAILARTIGIPALVGVDIDQKYEGKLAIVDGYEGKFIVDPDREVLAAYTEKKQQDEEKKKLLQQLRGKENVTKSGTWLSRDPYLSYQTGNLQNTASCTVSCQCIWQSFYYVSDNHIGKRSTGDQENLAGSPGRACDRRHEDRKCGRRYHDRNTCCSDHVR